MTEENRRAAADTLHQLARQIESGEVEVVTIDSNFPLVRVPGTTPYGPQDFEHTPDYTMSLHLRRRIPAKR